ncbi:hypothetical protein CW304_12010 [Bacillus sp. UFRGS-B20]|nr:hypothetical protein CW304_12010 [Bacillus sp. UFRGS-B20]
MVPCLFPILPIKRPMYFIFLKLRFQRYLKGLSLIAPGFSVVSKRDSVEVIGMCKFHDPATSLGLSPWSHSVY